MSVTRQDILKRIRYSKRSRRVQYDEGPPDGLGRAEHIPGTYEPGPGEAENRKKWLRKRLGAKKSKGDLPEDMTGHELLFRHMADTRPDLAHEHLVKHVNDFIDNAKMHKEWRSHMADDNGFEMPKLQAPVSAHWVSKHAAREADPREILSHQADFLDKHQKVYAAKKHLDDLERPNQAEPPLAP